MLKFQYEFEWLGSCGIANLFYSVMHQNAIFAGFAALQFMLAHYKRDESSNLYGQPYPLFFVSLMNAFQTSINVTVGKNFLAVLATNEILLVPSLCLIEGSMRRDETLNDRSFSNLWKRNSLLVATPLPNDGIIPLILEYEKA